MGISFERLDKREYKLLLDPGSFQGPPSLSLAERFWTGQLRPAIDDALGTRKSGKSRAKGTFSYLEQRFVRFFDTGDLLLDEHGFALRTREELTYGGAPGELGATLKLRTPDLLLAREFATAADITKKDKFEEDIAVLQVKPSDGIRHEVAVERRPSIYSRFSVSLRRELSVGLGELSDAFKQFDALRPELEAARGGKVEKRHALQTGPTVVEWVFEGASVVLGKEEAGFAFTLWYFEENGARPGLFSDTASGKLPPRVAEISFDFKTKDGRVAASVSRRASALLKKMRKALPPNLHATSKTKLALPKKQEPSTRTPAR